MRKQGKDPVDKDDDLTQALAYLNQSVAVINAAGLGPLNEHLATIAQHYAGLEEDLGAGQGVDKKKVRNRVRAVLVDVAFAFRDRIQDFKRRTLGDFQASDPIEVIFATALQEVKVPTSESNLAAAIALLQANAHLMEP